MKTEAYKSHWVRLFAPILYCQASELGGHLGEKVQWPMLIPAIYSATETLPVSIQESHTGGNLFHCWSHSAEPRITALLAGSIPPHPPPRAPTPLANQKGLFLIKLYCFPHPSPDSIRAAQRIMWSVISGQLLWGPSVKRQRTKGEEEVKRTDNP